MVNDVTSYIEAVRRSGLASADVLDALRVETAAAPQDVDAAGQKLIDAGVLTPWQHRMLRRGVSAGFFVGNYKLLGRIGVGGTSVVYLAVHTRLDRLAAIKLLDSRRADGGVSLERFFRESRATASLEHPNVVRVYDYDVVGAHHYLVLEYVDGPNLQDLVGLVGPLPVPQAAHYIMQAAAGLAFAHRRGLVHRDVKPGNLLVNSVGQLKVSDLGLARTEDPTAARVTREDGLLGTVDYVSPEQAFDSHHVGPPADVYSLGATFYFLLTGEPPFPTGTMASKLIRHQLETPRSLLERRNDVSPWLNDLVMRMTAKSPAARPSAENVFLSLSNWNEHHLHELFERGGCRPDSLPRHASPTPASAAETRADSISSETRSEGERRSASDSHTTMDQPSSYSIDVAALWGRPAADPTPSTVSRGAGSTKS